MNVVYFRFYAELNDFLHRSLRFRTFAYQFFGKPSVKDAIEALGVPHTQVDLILVDSEPVGFDHNLKNGERISVYPVFESIDISGISVQRRPLRELRFIADVHLGKLARLLRLCGFDVIYSNTMDDNAIIERAIDENRVILTRDKGILKNSRVKKGYFVKETNPHEQLDEVIVRFDLLSSIEPFTRCAVCNTRIVPVDKGEILHRLPPKTAKYYNEFSICPSCGRIYWKGSHYEKIKERITKITKQISGKNPGFIDDR